MRLTQQQKTQEMFLKIFDLSNASFGADERPPENIFRAHVNTDDVFILMSGVEDKIAGFAIVTECGGPYLWSLAISEAYRGCGNGKLLLGEVLSYYADASVTLTCKIDNVAAQVLYLKSGFRAVRVVPRYYGATDGLLMRRIS
jgi:ribosomal protein S18 acetylase RimI-like enzyme